MLHAIQFHIRRYDQTNGMSMYGRRQREEVQASLDALAAAHGENLELRRRWHTTTNDPSGRCPG